MTKYRFCIIAMVVFLSFGLATNGLAKVTKEEADRLNRDLTPFGAERAGNADGTIPAWEGGLPKVPEGCKPYTGEGGQFPDDPYAEDEILFTITNANLQQYKDKLAPGMIAMFKRFPEYKMNVYPSRRGHAYPERIYKLIYNNALNTSLSENKEGVVGQAGGIPFPIPKNAQEVMMNHLNNFYCFGIKGFYPGYLVFANGDIVNQGGAIYTGLYPNQVEGQEGKKHYNRLAMIDYVDPVRRKGEVILMLDPKDMSNEDLRTWQYMPGQRRVRRAPGISYDTPDPSTGNMGTYDDSYMFMGKIDRYDWKLNGKKEMYIMYNNFGINHGENPLKEFATPHYVNPDKVRWELHRVWEVEATLKEGKRHCYHKRVFWVDEDSWFVAHTDRYDNRGNLWRTMTATNIVWYWTPSSNPAVWIYYDFTEETYALNACAIDNGYEYGYGQFDQTVLDMVDEDFFSVENLRRMGRR